MQKNQVSNQLAFLNGLHTWSGKDIPLNVEHDFRRKNFLYVNKYI